MAATTISTNFILKTQTYGEPYLRLVFFIGKEYTLDEPEYKKQALEDYRAKRENGSPEDNPGPFPATDHSAYKLKYFNHITHTWIDQVDQRNIYDIQQVAIFYYEDERVKRWMEEKDLRYLRRIKRDNPAFFQQIVNANPNHPSVNGVQQEEAAILPQTVGYLRTTPGPMNEENGPSNSFASRRPLVFNPTPREIMISRMLIPQLALTSPVMNQGGTPAPSTQDITIRPAHLTAQPVPRPNELQANHASSGNMNEPELPQIDTGEIGRKGETIVYEHLTNKYQNKPYCQNRIETLAGFKCTYFSNRPNKGWVNVEVQWHNKHLPSNTDSGTNHDIKIIKSNGQHQNQERYIEVKTTKNSSNRSIYLTTNECHLMQFAGNRYSIYRVFNVTSDNPPRIEKIKDPAKAFAENKVYVEGIQFRY